MLFCQKITGILLVLGLVDASPVHHEKKSVTVNQVLQRRILSKDVVPHPGIQAYAKALGKFGAAKDSVAHLSALALKHGQRRDTQARSSRGSKTTRRSAQSSTSGESEQASIAATTNTAVADEAVPVTAGPLLTLPNQYDSQYLTQIQIGDQLFWMDFDTGSSDFWVFGPTVTGRYPNQTLWHESSTSTLIPNESWYISYGDGSYASGSLYTDQVYLGSVSIPKAAIEVAEYAEGTYDAPSSGILGLGFDKINTVFPTQQKTIFTELIEQNLITHPVLSADLKHNAAGCYTFGDTPWWQYSGSITYTDVDTDLGYWMFSPLGFGISNNPTNTSSSASTLLHGVLDTGTTLILIQDEIAAAYWSKVPSAVLDYIYYGGYLFLCNEVLPDWTLLVGEEGGATYNVRVAGSALNYAPLNDTHCYGSMQPTFGQVPFSIYGDVLLKSAFVVFDRSDEKQPKIGFADKGPY